MSVFSSVDAKVVDEVLLVSYLDQTAHAQSGIKHYAMAVHALRRPNGLVLDLGCGAGHDLALLGSVGVDAVGLDSSAVLLRTARRRSPRSVDLVQAAGEALPFRDGSLAGCRIERVLMHVVDPSAVLADAVRCLRRGALLTVFEPDWGSFEVRGDDGDKVSGWVNPALHPDVGGCLWTLIEDAGCDVLDRVEELSVWRSLDVLDRVVNLASSVDKAVSTGRISETDAAQWLAEQRARQAAGDFYSTLPKVLIVAQKP